MVLGPTYSLETVKEKIKNDEYKITQSALTGAEELGFDEHDIVHVVVNCLREEDFYKTMPAKKRKGYMQDVYNTKYREVLLYIKIQIISHGYNQNAVIISFKKK